MLACKSFFSASLVIAFAAIDVNIPGDFNHLTREKRTFCLVTSRFLNQSLSPPLPTACPLLAWLTTALASFLYEDPLRTGTFPARKMEPNDSLG